MPAGLGDVDEAAILKVDDAVALIAYTRVVRGYQYRGAGGGQILEEVDYLSSVLCIEGCGGLIREDEAWVVDHGAGDADALTFSAGELSRSSGGEFP